MTQHVRLEFTQSPGDTVVATAAVRALREQHRRSFYVSVSGVGAREVFTGNPDVIWGGKPDLKIKMAYPLVDKSNDKPVHFMHGYLDFLSRSLSVPLKLTVDRPVLHVHEPSPFVDPYWLICSGGKPDFTVKVWRGWQAVVDAFPGVRFVQVGLSDPSHVPLRGATNLIGATSLRELIVLARHCAGGLGHVSLLHHLCCAFRKPFVCVASGMEPIPWERYPGEVYISKHGHLPCLPDWRGCWQCRTVPMHDGNPFDKRLCELPVIRDGEATPKCLDMVDPAEVIEALHGLL